MSTSRAALVAQLNQLIGELHIPISIESPWELTPSLILAVLESMLRKRLPVPQALRDARDVKAKSQTMKIFLDYAADLLEGEQDLSEVDSERLALGGWDEVVFVGEVLCWLGSKRGYIPDVDVQQPHWNTMTEISLDLRNLSLAESHVLDSVPLPPRAKLVRTTHTSLSKLDTHSPSSTSGISHVSEATQATSYLRRPVFKTSERIRTRVVASPSPVSSSSPGSRTPRCIHELERPSPSPKYVHLPPTAQSDTSDDDDEVDTSVSTECPSGIFHPPKEVSIRRTGWIEPVDIGEELRSFEDSHPVAKRSPKTPRSGPRSYPHTPVASGGPRRVVTRLNSPTQHALALLNERAKLTQELAALKISAAR
ncbi:hypothetical protein PsYK624_048910 [Phanerochaete sordida]|uniref:Uncharacterized protein n=1 Tax=Phanerochaete sordida TaxID=48140 RepID=A0A9P3G7D2_9APHY|nr:hypothetical protein PsYK624_048910 [Phanerochaete sordida]